VVYSHHSQHPPNSDPPRRDRLCIEEKAKHSHGPYQDRQTHERNVGAGDKSGPGGFTERCAGFGGAGRSILAGGVLVEEGRFYPAGLGHGLSERMFLPCF
jgi:hypothetical protein